VADILTALSLLGVYLPTPTGAGEARREYDGPDRALFDVLSPDPISLDQLVRATGLDLPALCGGLERLARAGVARDVGGWWERT
jgi:predicted Rossmann fold nucleotide-binding protein DprA/Smf involved in DNA uptake